MQQAHTGEAGPLGQENPQDRYGVPRGRAHARVRATAQARRGPVRMLSRMNVLLQRAAEGEEATGSGDRGTQTNRQQPAKCRRV